MRTLILSVFCLYSSALLSQTIPASQLRNFIACLPIARSENEPARFVANTFTNFSYASTPAERDSFLYRSECEQGLRSGNAVEVAVFNRAFKGDRNYLKSLISVAELKITVSLMNDLQGFERQEAAIAVWKDLQDSLSLDFLVKEPITSGIGMVCFEGHALFPDTTLLLVVRRFFEMYQQLLFLRISRDHSLQQLYTSQMFFEAADVRGDGNIHDSRGRSFRLETRKDGAIIVRLPALRQVTISESNIGDIIDEMGEWTEVDLWDLASTYRSNKNDRNYSPNRQSKRFKLDSTARDSVRQ